MEIPVKSKDRSKKTNEFEVPVRSKERSKKSENIFGDEGPIKPKGRTKKTEVPDNEAPCET